MLLKNVVHFLFGGMRNADPHEQVFLSGERFREFLDELIGFIDNDDRNVINV